VNFSDLVVWWHYFLKFFGADLNIKLQCIPGALLYAVFNQEQEHPAKPIILKFALHESI
jgi:hypothetical protein